MATFGRVQEFHLDSESITAYIERVQLFYAANDIAVDKKVPVLLSLIGGKNYELLRNLLAPTLPQEKSFDDLVQCLKCHFEPEPVIIAERYRFHCRNQTAGESVAEFLAELKRLATHCQFGAFLEEALRDRLVCGLRSESVQKRLLAETDLTLKRATIWPRAWKRPTAMLSC